MLEHKRVFVSFNSDSYFTDVKTKTLRFRNGSDFTGDAVK